MPDRSRQRVLDYISAHWDDTVRHTPADTQSLLGLPYPYTVPCRRDTFQEMYYWDTFYTNEGLIATGRVEQARYNTDNILHLIGRFGFMPNGSHERYLDRSQPPHAALMVKSVFEATGDRDWLARCVPVLVREHAFWMTRRLAPLGLNRYGHHAEAGPLAAYSWSDRIADPATLGSACHLRGNGHNLAECESGWDFSPRFDRRCEDFCPVDLNSLLFAHETALADFFAELKNPREASAWRERAANRRSLMNRHLWSEEGQAYFDYDFVRGRLGEVLSAAIFFPVWLGASDARQTTAVAAQLPRLEGAHGLYTCEPGRRNAVYQWDAPNGWPPLHYVAVQALRRAGRKADADRLAAKYLETVAANFTRSGDLWEKYNAHDGSIRVQNEYEMPAMLGWTAGVFAFLAAQVPLPSSVSAPRPAGAEPAIALR